MWSIPETNPQGRAFMTVIIVFAVVAVLAFCLRVYSRRLNRVAFDASDYTCLLGLVLDIGLVVILFGAFSHGWGEDITMFGLEDARIAAHIFIAIDIVWNAAVVSVRTSILLFYIRIFAVRRFRMICWSIIALNVASLISVILATCLICQPILYSFDKTIPNGHCGDLASFTLYTGIWNLICDSIIVVLPMPMLWGLQMQTKKKIGLSIVLGMGAIICALTLTRVICSIYYEPNNYTISAALTALITGLEPIAGVINACLPFMPLVFKRLGQTHIFSRLSATFKSFTMGSSEEYSTAASGSKERRKHSAPFQGLSDVEMKPVNDSGFATSYISIGSHNSILESGTWDGNRGGQDRVFVRNDFCIESEPC